MDKRLNVHEGQKRPSVGSLFLQKGFKSELHMALQTRCSASVLPPSKYLTKGIKYLTNNYGATLRFPWDATACSILEKAYSMRERDRLPRDVSGVKTTFHTRTWRSICSELDLVAKIHSPQLTSVT